MRYGMLIRPSVAVVTYVEEEGEWAYHCDDLNLSGGLGSPDLDATRADARNALEFFLEIPVTTGVFLADNTFGEMRQQHPTESFVTALGEQQGN